MADWLMFNTTPEDLDSMSWSCPDCNCVNPPGHKNCRDEYFTMPCNADGGTSHGERMDQFKKLCSNFESACTILSPVSPLVLATPAEVRAIL